MCPTRSGIPTAGPSRWSARLRTRHSPTACGPSWPRFPETGCAELEIDAEDSVVVLRGTTSGDELRRIIIEAAGKVPEVEEVRCEITVPRDIFRS